MTTEIKQHTRRSPQPPIDPALVVAGEPFQKNRADNQGKPPVIVIVEDVAPLAGVPTVAYRYRDTGKRQMMALTDFCRGSEHKIPDPEPVAEPIAVAPPWSPETTAEAEFGPVTADVPPEEPAPASGIATRDTWRASEGLDAVPIGSAEEERMRARAWMDTAAQHCRNEEYWRDRAIKAEQGPAHPGLAEDMRSVHAKLDELLTLARPAPFVDVGPTPSLPSLSRLIGGGT